MATHLMVTHKQEGSKCQICGKVMSKYHMSDHLDHHSLSKRFQCKEKLPGGAVCERSYKQKSALVRHLKEKHQKSLQSAHVHIKKNVQYETTGDYQDIEGEERMRAEQINHLVGEYGEVVYQ